MLSVKPGLAALAVGGVLAASALLLAPAADAAPTSAECLSAQQQLNAARIALTTAQNQLAADRAAGALNSTILADQAAVSQAQGTVTLAQNAVNLQCGGTTGGGVGLPHPGPIGYPYPGTVGLPHHHVNIPRTGLTCAQLAAYGLTSVPCNAPVGTVYTVGDIPCSYINGTWVPTSSIPVGTVETVNGVHCHWTGTAWQPVTVVQAPAPCNCDPNPAPVAIVQAPAPQVVRTVTVQAPAQTVGEPAPVSVPAQQVFTNPVAPSVGAVATGDGSMAGQL